MFDKSSVEKGRKSFKLFISGFGNVDYRSICLYLNSLSEVKELNKEFFVDMSSDKNINSVFSNLYLFISRQDQVLADYLWESNIKLVPTIDGTFSTLKDLSLTNAENNLVSKSLFSYLKKLQPEEPCNIPSSGLNLDCLCKEDRNKSVVSLLANSNNCSNLPLDISYWCLLQCISSSCSSLAVVQNTLCRVGSVGEYKYKNPGLYGVQNYVICNWCLDYLKTLFTYIVKYSKTQQEPKISGFSSWSKEQGFEFNTTICYLLDSLIDCMYSYSSKIDLCKFRNIVNTDGLIRLEE